MSDALSSFLSLVAPVALGVFLLSLQFYIRKEVIDRIKLHLPVFQLFGVEAELIIQNLVFIRILLLSSSLICFAVPAFRDYGSFFPARLHMEVFFDDEGVEHALSQFNSQELTDIKIMEDWRIGKKEFLADLSAKIEKQIHVRFRFDGTRGSVHSQGEVFMEVKKIKGFQKYHIERLEGSLEHVMENPGQKDQVLTSEFRLLETEANRVEASLKEIYFKYTKTIRPELKQIVRISPVQELYDHELVALTKVRFFPLADIGRTIYLVRDRNTDKVVPIGYCIYTPE
ncbi:MAG: hypothetical protein HY268_18910 [Deltaproteobacteria bacterium]|nr:hypothetical protein [Deltaproteobacteria bacterium]